MKKIEDAIKQQRPFRSAHHRATGNLIYTSKSLTGRIKALLKPHNITLQQYNVLRILHGAGEPISTSVIRDRLLDNMSDTSRIVERMHQKGWVKREICSSDKRLVDVSLTPQGKKLFERLKRENDQLDNILGNLSESEAFLLSDLLDKAREGQDYPGD